MRCGVVRVCIRGVVLTLLVCVVVPLSLANDSTLTPLEQIPKLPESFDLADYKQLFAGGTLLPDRVTWDTISIRVGMSETGLKSCLPDSGRFEMSTQARTRREQWAILREILAHANYSMHYYILAGIYYDQQLSGWFREYRWTLDGVGDLTVHLHSEDPDGGYRVWLIQLPLVPTGVENLTYQPPPGLVLVRSGDRPVEWNIDRNSLTLGPGR